jgi:hypothetical protein
MGRLVDLARRWAVDQAAIIRMAIPPNKRCYDR